jgi:hypothetical protein
VLYSEIVERVIQGVVRIKPDVSRARLTMQIDAGFSQINSQVSEAFAAREDKRSLLRKNVPLVFVNGSIGFPSNVLRKYLKDATLVLSTGEKAALIEPYDDFLRVRDNRLPWWAFNDSVLSAINSAVNGGSAYAGNATLTCLATPDAPATPATAYAGPDDMIPELIDALISFALGKTENEAAETT